MLFTLKGIGKTLEVYENKIVIRYGFLSGDHWRQTKEIYLSSITGIQVKKPGLSAGYIQFMVAGSQEVKGGRLSSVQDDENTIMFNGQLGKKTPKQQYEDACVIKAKIEELKSRGATGTTVVNQASPADELRKFKSLLDDGIITQAEFDAKKKELLGL